MQDYKPLFGRLGGEEIVNEAVDLFYDKILADDTINSFFKHMDMPSQAAKQKMFLSHIFGGKDDYKGRSLRESHKHMNLKSIHFEAVAKHLLTTLRELNIDSDLVAEVALTVYKTKDDILNIKK